MHRSDRLTGAEVIASTALSLLASTILVAYVFDRFGVAFTPLRILPISSAAAVAVFAWLRRDVDWQRVESAAFAGVVIGVFAWLMWLARPDFLPLGSGPDLTHHLLLIGFIEKHWTLVHDASAEPFLLEMIYYTPGSHLLAALAGAASGTDGLHAVHPVVAATVALKAGFVFLIALRVLPAGVPRIPFALTSVLLMLIPSGYSPGSFVHHSFFAQVVSEFFVVAMWWMLTVWDESPGSDAVALFALAGMAAFLTWPILIGAPLVALAAIVLLHAPLPLRQRAQQLAVAVVPIALVAGLYIAGRLSWLHIVTTGGDVFPPSVQQYGWWFLSLSAAGFVLASIQRRGRATALFIGAIALEAAGLYIAARTRGSEDAPYMAFKMFYLLIYPQAVTATLAIATFYAAVIPSRLARRAAWAVAIVVGALVTRALAAAPRPTPVISEPLYRAGAWARDHVQPSCVDYLVGNMFTAYWLHVSVLGNPRRSARTEDYATVDRTAAIVRWLTTGGFPYAIADLPSLPSDVRSELNIVADFGSAAVVKRRGSSSCPESR